MERYLLRCRSFPMKRNYVLSGFSFSLFVDIHDWTEAKHDCRPFSAAAAIYTTFRLKEIMLTTCRHYTTGSRLMLTLIMTRSGQSVLQSVKARRKQTIWQFCQWSTNLPEGLWAWQLWRLHAAWHHYTASLPLSGTSKVSWWGTWPDCSQSHQDWSDLWKVTSQQDSASAMPSKANDASANTVHHQRKPRYRPTTSWPS